MGIVGTDIYECVKIRLQDKMTWFNRKPRGGDQGTCEPRLIFAKVNVVSFLFIRQKSPCENEQDCIELFQRSSTTPVCRL